MENNESPTTGPVIVRTATGTDTHLSTINDEVLNPYTECSSRARTILPGAELTCERCIKAAAKYGIALPAVA